MRRFTFAAIVVLGLAGLAGVVAWQLSASSRVRAEAEQAGLASVSLGIEKMSCRGCRAAVTRTLERARGVRSFSMDRKGATVAYDPERFTPRSLADYIFEKTGFRAWVRESDASLSAPALP